MQPQSFQNIVEGAADQGWDWFKQVDPAIREKLGVHQAKDDADSKAIAAAWARFAGTADGQKALEKLFDTTLRRTVFFASLGLDPTSMAVFGAFREGQNAVAHEIARQIGIGNQEAVKPRDV